MTKIPRNVLRFERLMYLALAIGITLSLQEDIALQEDIERFRAGHGALSSYAAGIAAGAAAYVLAVWAVARRRQSWLRWLFLILFVIAAVSAIYSTFTLSRQIGAELYLRAVQMRPIPIIATTVQNFAQGFALFFVFTGDARPWFRKKRQKIDPEVFS